MVAMAEEYEARYDNAIIHSFPPFPKGMPLKYFDAGLAYFENFTGFGDTYDILAVEEKFEIDIRGYTFVGVADLVLRDKLSGEISVVDHKSKSLSSMKKELNMYRRQLYIYAAFVKDKYGVYPSKQRFNMLKEGAFIDEDFNQADFDATMDWVEETIQAIHRESEWAVSRSAYFCRFICSTLDSCPDRNIILEK